MNTLTATHVIPEHRLDELAERLDQLNRRAKRLGLETVATMALSGEPYVHSFPRSEAEAVQGQTYYTGHVTMQPVTVTGTAPKLAGWTLVAAIDHGESSGDIIKSILGRDIPVEYRTRGPVCDHCKHKRKRNLTFVCQHDDQRWTQVGSTCLGDFTGSADPDKIASLCSMLGDLAAFGRDLEDIGEYGSRVRPEYALVSVLRAAAAAVRVQGFYVSRAKASEAADKGEYLTTTSSIVSSLMACRPGDEKKILGSDGYIANDAAIAESTLEFVRKGGIVGDGDYAYNVNTLFSDTVCGAKSVGIVGSTVASYLRTQARIAAESATGTAHFGTVGKRETFTLTVISTMVRSGDYGLSTIVKFQDLAGNPAIWFATGDRSDSLKAGQTGDFTATVKKHDTYKGHVSTVLSRVK